MNLQQKLRQLVGKTQQQLADAVGTSQPTIAAYESGSKSPTLRTFTQMMKSLNVEWTVQFHSELTRENKRSLAYHKAITEHLYRHPDPALAKAKSNLKKLKKQHPAASALFNRWEQWLALPVHDLAYLLQSPSTDHCDMRQVSPFAGVLSATERTQILKQFAKERAA